MKSFLTVAKNPLLSKLLLIMKLTSFLLLAFALHVSAEGIGQKLNLRFKRTEIAGILSYIEKETDYRFLYNGQLKNVKRKVSLDMEAADIKQALDKILLSSGLMYQFMENNLIVIKPDDKYSPPKPVTGKITDENGVPLAGVSINIKGTNTGTTTNEKGEFAIDANEEDVLTFSYVGFESQEQKVGTNPSFSIVLNSVKKDLDAVIVIGYGAVKKRDLTGSVISVKGDEMKKVPSGNVMESLQGKLPGADITRNSGSASSGVTMTVRGNRSISANNGPLVIVDGVIYPSIQDINANDIQSLEVLKDASSTAIYGARGANGVLLVTTKKGTSGKPKVSLNSYYGISQLSQFPRFMNGTEYANLRREANKRITLANINPAGTWNDNANDNLIFNNEELTNLNNGVNTDYLDLVISDGHQQEHTVGISAGSEKTKVYGSLGFYNERGMFKNDELKRFTGRLSLDQTISRIFKVGMQMQYSRYQIDMRTNPIDEASKISSFSRAYDDLGQLIRSPNSESARWNPLFDELPNVSVNNQIIDRTLAIAYAELSPVKGLSLRSNLGLTVNNSRTGKFYDVLSLNSRGGASVASDSANFGRNLTWENIATYGTSFGEHNLNITGVTSYQQTNGESLIGKSNGLLLPSSLFYNLGVGTSPSNGSGYVKEALFSLTGRVNYSYKGKYLASFSVRRDRSSKYRGANQSGVFPAGAIAWRIIDEPFMSKSRNINELKLRVSYGLTGNDPASAYVTQSVLNTVPNAFGEAVATGLYFSNLVGNPDLIWEKTKALNIGIDFGLFANRLNGAIDFYKTNTYDLILERALPPTTGAGKVLQNVGKTSTYGLDLSLNAVVVNHRDFKFNAGLTFFTNKEKVVSLVDGLSTMPVNGRMIVVGSPVNVIYDYEKLGIWQLVDSTAAKGFNQVPGDIRLLDLNKDNKITDLDRKVVGQLTPKWNAGLNLDFTYKGFDLNVFLFARVGQWMVYDYNNRFHLQGRENSAVLNYWTLDNPGNDFPHPRSTAALTSLLGYTTLANVEASFLKIRSATLGYNLPSSMTARWGLSRVRFYVSGRNLATFSKIDNYDVERGGNITNPLSRLFLGGVNIDF